MLNFTVGPVQSGEAVCAIGQEQVPYFRTPEFSALMKENEALMLRFTDAGAGARTVFLTGSGTAAMEAAVMNCFTADDKVLVINGGSFGERFAKLCAIYQIPHEELRLNPGEPLTRERLYSHEHEGFTGLLVNLCETSTGVLYDARMIGNFCRRNGIFWVADAISSFLADECSMDETGAGVILTGSQKALACPPGISILVLSAEAIGRIEKNTVRSLYLDLKNALKDGERGQTPFTPAVGILRQIHSRLKEIEAAGGVTAEREKIAALAADFRTRIKALPFELFTPALSNAVTALHPKSASARQIFLTLKDEYDIWVCPNGGSMAETVFRVGHIGALTKEDNETLIRALTDMKERGLL